MPLLTRNSGETSPCAATSYLPETYRNQPVAQYCSWKQSEVHTKEKKVIPTACNPSDSTWNAQFRKYSGNKHDRLGFHSRDYEEYYLLGCVMLAALPVFTLHSAGDGSCIISGSVVDSLQCSLDGRVSKLKWCVGGSDSA
jgi:hypothetical protein